MMEVTNSRLTKMGNSWYLPVRFLESMRIGYRMYFFPVKNWWIGYIWIGLLGSDKIDDTLNDSCCFIPDLFGASKRASIQGFCVSKTHGIGRFFGGTSGHKTSELLDVSKAEQVWPNHQRKYSNIFCLDASYSGFWNEDVWISNFKSPPLFKTKNAM